MCSFPGCHQQWNASLARTSQPCTQPMAPPLHQTLDNQWGDFCYFFPPLEAGYGVWISTLNCGAAHKRFQHSPGCCIMEVQSPLPGTYLLLSPPLARWTHTKKCNLAICLASLDNNIHYFNSELMSSRCKQPEAPIQAVGSSQPVIY